MGSVFLEITPNYIVIFIGFINAYKMPTYDADSAEINEHKSTIFDLVELGKTITKKLKNPSGPGNKFLKDLLVYREDISWLRTFVRLNETGGRIVYKAIKKQGGPPLLNIDLNESALKAAFNWTKKEIKEVKGALREIDVMFSHMEIYQRSREELVAPLFYKRKDG